MGCKADRCLFLRWVKPERMFMESEKVITIELDSPELKYLCSKDKRLGKVIASIGPITYTQRDDTDSYAFLVHEIIEQMLSIKAGKKIYLRLSELCNGEINPQTISALSVEQLKGTGTSTAKATYIKCLTNDVLSGKLNLINLKNESDSTVIKQLTSVRGIGTWTAKMFLLFILGRQDILPYEDGAFLQSYRWLYKDADCSPSAIKKKCKKWSPYSSIAARYLYRALDMGLTKEEFHLFK